MQQALVLAVCVSEGVYRRERSQLEKMNGIKHSTQKAVLKLKIVVGL